MRKYKVVILNVPHPSFDVEKELLSDIADIKVSWCNRSEGVIEAASDADAVMVGDIAHIPLTDEILGHLNRVKVISMYGVGTDAIDLKAAKERKIAVTNVPDYGISEVADHTMALMLCLLRKVPALDKALRDLGWEKVRGNIAQIRKMFGEIRRLDSISLGLIGFGRIGRAVAERAKAFGLNVMAFGPYVPEEVFVKMGVQRKDMRSLLRESDVVSMHVVLTEETRYMITEKEISEMKKGAFIINTSRGAVIDEKALVKALCEGQLAGVALDVFEREPLPADSMLLQMKNIILTPHVAWYSEEAMQDQKRKAALNVRKILKREAPLYAVST